MEKGQHKMEKRFEAYKLSVKRVEKSLHFYLAKRVRANEWEYDDFVWQYFCTLHLIALNSLERPSNFGSVDVQQRRDANNK